MAARRPARGHCVCTAIACPLVGQRLAIEYLFGHRVAIDWQFIGRPLAGHRSAIDWPAVGRAIVGPCCGHRLAVACPAR
eukprot:11181882-Lingulodinium_polyedra.AAC.1